MMKNIDSGSLSSSYKKGGVLLVGGVISLFVIFAGVFWLIKEAMRESGEKRANQKQDQLANDFIKKHTDLAMENALRKRVEDPAYYDAVWERLETYKKDNPVWCKEHEERGHYDANGRYVEPVFGWQSVGKERIAFRDVDGSLTPRNLNYSMQLAYNRDHIVGMLMQTYGKMSLVNARDAANKKYPVIPSKRKW